MTQQWAAMRFTNKKLETCGNSGFNQEQTGELWYF
jgi:hypothetical protein